MNKYKIAGLLVCAAMLTVLGSGCVSNVPKPDRALIASGHPEWPPIMFKNGDVIDGAGPALVKKIFDELGIQTAFPYTGTWDEVQAKAKSGEVDVLVAAYQTTARAGYMAYSVAYTIDPIVLFVKKGNEFTFAKNADLIGKKGVGTTGDSYGQEFDDFLKAHLQVQWVANIEEAFTLVANGQADYFIYSLYSGQEELKKEGRRSLFTTLPRLVAEEHFYITISKKSPFLHYLPEVNRLIEKNRADGTLDQLIAKYKARNL